MEEVVSFSLNNFQSSSITFCRVLVQGAMLPLFTINALALVTLSFIIFHSNYTQLCLGWIYP